MKRIIVCMACSFVFGFIARTLTAKSNANEIHYRESVWYWCGIAAGSIATGICLIKYKQP